MISHTCEIESNVVREKQMYKGVGALISRTKIFLGVKGNCWDLSLGYLCRKMDALVVCTWDIIRMRYTLNNH